MAMKKEFALFDTAQQAVAHAKESIAQLGGSKLKWKVSEYQEPTYDGKFGWVISRNNLSIYFGPQGYRGYLPSIDTYVADNQPALRTCLRKILDKIETIFKQLDTVFGEVQDILG